MRRLCSSSSQGSAPRPIGGRDAQPSEAAVSQWTTTPAVAFEGSSTGTRDFGVCRPTGGPVMVFASSPPPVSHIKEEEIPEADLRIAIDAFSATVAGAGDAGASSGFKDVDEVADPARSAQCHYRSGCLWALRTSGMVCRATE